MKRLQILAALAAAMIGFSGMDAQAQGSANAGKGELLWLGQATFRITSPGGKVIVTDPWLRPNPRTPAEYKDLAALGKVDVLLVTHGHGDHIADAPDLARMHNIPVYMPGDLGQTLITLGVLPSAQLPRFNKGGIIEPVPGIKFTAVRAEHSSIYVFRNPVTGKDESHYGGEPIGYIIEMENGFRIYHMGDTDMFGDLTLIASRYKPDMVLIPIGGNFTMNPAAAAEAVSKMLKPKYVVPMHYGSNPLAKGTAKEFTEAMARQKSKVQVLVMDPGGKLSF